MRNTLYAASLVAIVLQVTAGSAAAQEVGRLRYEIDATFDLERSEIQGHARIEVPYSLLWSPSEIRLDLKSAGADSLDRPRLEITSVRIADELRTTDVAEGYLRVSLPVAARVGEVVVLEIDYMCAFNTSYDLLGYHSFWSVGPGSYWYPDVVGAGNARGRFKDFLVTLNYPSEFAAVTSGTPDSQATEAGGFTRGRRLQGHRPYSSRRPGAVRAGDRPRGGSGGVVPGHLPRTSSAITTGACTC
jgi:hypothetical protein